MAESSCQASLALEYICDYPYQKDQGLVTSGKSESSEAAFLERIIRTLKRAAEGETRPYDDCTEIHAQLFE